MLKIKNLKISFDKKTIIDSISSDVPRGSTLVILGKNGSGKSVILKTIAGLIPDYSGTIEINNNDIRAGFKDYKLAYVFQKGGLFDSMNVFENVAFGLVRMGTDSEVIYNTVTDSLKRVGLLGSESKIPSELSGGMQKRVGLARSICMNPDIILYDDPTAGLDPILSDSISDLLIEIRDSMNTTSIAVTHDLKVAEKIADNIILLYNGKAVFTGTGEEFFSKTNSFAYQFIEGEIEGPIDIF